MNGYAADGHQQYLDKNVKMGIGATRRPGSRFRGEPPDRPAAMLAACVVPSSASVMLRWRMRS